MITLGGHSAEVYSLRGTGFSLNDPQTQKKLGESQEQRWWGPEGFPALLLDTQALLLRFSTAARPFNTQQTPVVVDLCTALYRKLPKGRDDHPHSTFETSRAQCSAEYL